MFSNMISRAVRTNAFRRQKTLPRIRRSPTSMIKKQWITQGIQNRTKNPFICSQYAKDHDHVARNTMSSKETVKIMLKHKISAVFVVDKENKVVGVVTERDMMQLISNDDLDENGPVEQIMTPADKLYTMDPKEKDIDVLGIMLKHNIRHLPIVDKTKGVIGMTGLKEVVEEVHDKLEKENISMFDYIHS